jgi:hypothetical protein
MSSCLVSNNVKIKVYKTITLPVVLHGCETWSLTLREEQRPRMSENRVLRRISGPNGDEVTGGWREPCNEQLLDLHLLLNTVKPVLNGISKVQNIFPLKPGFRLIKIYYDSHGT